MKPLQTKWLHSANLDPISEFVNQSASPARNPRGCCKFAKDICDLSQTVSESVEQQQSHVQLLRHLQRPIDRGRHGSAKSLEIRICWSQKFHETSYISSFERFQSCFAGRARRTKSEHWFHTLEHTTVYNCTSAYLAHHFAHAQKWLRAVQAYRNDVRSLTLRKLYDCWDATAAKIHPWEGDSSMKLGTVSNMLWSDELQRVLIISGLLHSTYHDYCRSWIYCHFAKHHCNNYQSCGYHCHVVITIIKYHQHLSLSKIFNSQSFASGLPNTSSIGGDGHGNQPPTSFHRRQDMPRCSQNLRNRPDCVAKKCLSWSLRFSKNH